MPEGLMKNRFALPDALIIPFFDEKRDHYQWMNVGWEGLKRVYRCIIHFDIKNGKIWLQQNLTDQNPAEELVAMGVPREDIVLGLQPTYKRQYTDYGVA
ncbi:MAG: XisI protein [Aetokthonos hydrillicola CCALA 1050]|nr:XisI protein [Aetokthonos hydrillicola CCALA 1050]MBW4584659.1 XisI protein [Aetokthonos hydrillicola CCALA 1050]